MEEPLAAPHPASYEHGMRLFRPSTALLASIPAFLTLPLSGCENSTDTQGGAAAIVVATKETGPLPVLGQVPAFSFTNEEGETFGSKDLSGKPYLAAFMFTRCPSICPQLTAKMKEVSDSLADGEQELRLVSFSVDPENDTPEVLKAYAKKHHADLPHWSFLTGDYKLIAKTAEQSFKLALSGEIDEKKPHLGITHGSHLVLVDGNGNLRGYFRSSEKEAAAAVARALRRLSL